MAKVSMISRSPLLFRQTQTMTRVPESHDSDQAGQCGKLFVNQSERVADHLHSLMKTPKRC